MKRPLLLFAIVAVAQAAPAVAYWSAGGSGSGSGLAATMPAANQPSGSASGTSVTVTWSQNTFAGGPLGSYAGGGYVIKRYAQGSSSAITPNTGCDATISGATATLQCVETGVSYGAWQYTAQPVLGTFTGDEGPKSATVTVATAAPTLSSVTAQNPATGQTTGAIELTWTAVTGATGYNVYRRTASGSYDYASALNGATPLSAGTTTYTDPGAGLTGGTSYHYVVRAVAGSPTVESASSNDANATAIARPAAPSGAVTATAAVAARIDVGWTSVAGASGYNVYRRTSAGSYNFSAPVNGATPYAGTTYGDTTAVNATTYLYTVRAVIIGAGGAQVESDNSSESNAATADSTPPPVPTAVTVNNGGNLLTSAICSIANGTRYINTAGAGSVSVSATIAAPEAGETVVFTATTPGSTAVTSTVAATGTSVSTTMNLSSLLDGTVTLTAQTKDLPGNLSTTKAPTNGIIKDTVVPPLSGVAYNDRAIFADQITGTSQCGAKITAVQTAPGNTTYGPQQIASGTAFTLNVQALALGSYSYNVTATDLAGNTSAVTVVSGSAFL